MRVHRNLAVWGAAATLSWATLIGAAAIGSTADEPATVPLTDIVASDPAAHTVLGFQSIRGNLRTLDPSQVRDQARRIAADATARADILRQRGGELDLTVAAELDQLAGTASTVAAGNGDVTDLLVAIDRLDGALLDPERPRTQVPAESNEARRTPQTKDLPDPGHNDVPDLHSPSLAARS